MDFSDEQLERFGIALNEAVLLGVEIYPVERWASITLAALALPEDGPEPEDPRVRILLRPVGRLAASLRHGRWDDPAAPVEAFGLERLSGVVASFNQLPIYGWEFLDVPARKSFSNWEGRLSLDWRTGPDGLSHTLELFQESAGEQILDLRFWFDELRIADPVQNEIAFDDFVSRGVRWWDALYAGDPRTAGHGIVPLGPENEG